MKAEWTGEAVGIMHVHEISPSTLAEKVGWNPKYLSAVLNCRRRPKKAEKVVLTALRELVGESADGGDRQ